MMLDNYETKRTIEEVFDKETGEYINSYEFFKQPESIIINYRRRLEEAIKGFAPVKFVCSNCGQLVKLSGMKTKRGRVLFFAHLYDSDECEIKTDRKISKEEIERNKYSRVRESLRHIILKDKISQALLGKESKRKGIGNVEIEKRINSVVPYLNWRQPDVYAEFDGKKIVFELQLSTTFLSVLVERDIFYRMNNMFIVWVFNFSDNQQYVNMSNLMCKDIYYANKRNAFVFDETAQRLSEEKGELILNCIWFEPKVINGIFYPNDRIRKSEYVRFLDFKFDETSFKPYYVDADKLFYQYQPELNKERENLENDTLLKFRKIIRTSKKELDESEERERIISTIKEKLQNGELELTAFFHEGYWGYEVNGVVIIEPIYNEVSNFQNNKFAVVKRNNRFGFIDKSGDLITPCKFNEVFEIHNDKSIVKQEKDWFCLDLQTKNYRNLNCDEIYPFEDSDIFLKTTRKEIKKRYAGTNRGGYNTYYNEPVERVGIITYEGKIILQGYKRIYISKRKVIIAEKYDTKEIFTKDFKPITTDTFQEVSVPYSGDKIICKDYSGYGCIDFNGNTILPFNYEKIEIINENLFAARLDEIWGVLDEEGNEVIPFKYLSIEYLGSDLAAFKNYENEKIGCLNLNGETVIPFEFDEVEIIGTNIVKAKRGSKWGCVNLKGETIVPFIYDSIEKFHQGLARASRNGKFGFINELGDEIIEEVIELENNISKVRKFEMWGLQKNQKSIIPCVYEDIGEIKDLAINVKKNGRWGIIDWDGNEINENESIIENDFIVDNQSNIGNNLIKGEKFGKWGIEKANGEIIVPYEYDEILDYSKAGIIVKRFGKYGVFKIGSGLIISPIFDEIRFYQNENFLLKKDKKWGIANSHGQITLQVVYDFFLPYSEGKAFCFSGGFFTKRKNQAFKAVQFRALVREVKSFGVFLELTNSEFCRIDNYKKSGLLPISEIKKANKSLEDFKSGEEVNVYIFNLIPEFQRFNFSIRNAREDLIKKQEN